MFAVRRDDHHLAHLIVQDVDFPVRVPLYVRNGFEYLGIWLKIPP
jgi:hypothetical protein